ncbi:class I SAM-dependent methyltransferase [Pseudanabaena sp. Chao 1811]|uniref:class I SAM-dependent methyltransferase n=1 Tax=Pseudanabaena sp. Chao 1811 TaxID=2963092 RepID=UPI0022F38A7D|nr:class I SAM-dependent methyltransferase [Pseudanabaena sp. Chao 1811]
MQDLKNNSTDFQSNSGFRYHCPLCDSSLETFLPFGLDFPVLKEKSIIGGGQRDHALCPNCGSLDRERLVYLYLKNKTNIFEQPTKLLHMAPELKLENILRQQKNIDYLSADLYLERVMVKMDITNMAWEEATFDAIICNHILEHIIDDHLAMSELYRVLKPNGWAILQVPISYAIAQTYEDATMITPEQREQAFGQSDHVRIYSHDYCDRLKQVGFKVDVFEWIKDDQLFGGQENKFGLIKEERVFFVTK